MSGPIRLAQLCIIVSDTISLGPKADMTSGIWPK